MAGAADRPGDLMPHTYSIRGEFKSSYLIQTALGSSPVITIFYRLGIRTHNQISVHSGGYQNALTQNAGALKDYMVDQIAAGLIQQIVLSA